jgi:DNA-binding beta-propeller fold protein YncE
MAYPDAGRQEDLDHSVSDGGIYVYDIASKKLGKRIAVGECPNWISMSHDGKYAAVSNAEPTIPRSWI